MENKKMTVKYASVQDFFTNYTNTGLRTENMRGGSSLSIPPSFMVKKNGFDPEINEIEFHIDEQYIQEFDGHVSKVELYSVVSYDDINLLCIIKKRTIIQNDKSIEVEVIKVKKGE